jgi:glycosyltransferase involved in cell wall biosynthesis
LRVCIFTNHFYPENFRINDIAFEFAQKGYEITVITAIPDYPQGKFYDGYSLFKRRKEVINKVRIIRLPIIPRGKGKASNLILNYASYFISSLIFIFFHSFTNKYNIAFVHLTSPFFISLSAVLLKQWQRISLIFWVLDLWPESLVAAGKINNKFVLQSQTKFVQYIYNNCDKILIGSYGFRKSICEKGNYEDKLVYFPNWAEYIKVSHDMSRIRRLDFFPGCANDDFIILFAGNIGEAQNLDFIIDVAAEMAHANNVKFIFLGDGRKRKHLEDKTRRMGLSSHVLFLGQHPLDSMPMFMQMADVLLVSLKDEPIFNLTIPSKIQFYMAQGKPILAVLNGDGGDLINEAKCGISVRVNDSRALRLAINKLYQMPKNELFEIGLRGKRYYDCIFLKEKRMNQLDLLFKAVYLLQESLYART